MKRQIVIVEIAYHDSFDLTEMQRQATAATIAHVVNQAVGSRSIMVDRVYDATEDPAKLGDLYETAKR